MTMGPSGAQPAINNARPLRHLLLQSRVSQPGLVELTNLHHKVSPALDSASGAHFENLQDSPTPKFSSFSNRIFLNTHNSFESRMKTVENDVSRPHV